MNKKTLILLSIGLISAVMASCERPTSKSSEQSIPSSSNTFISSEESSETSTTSSSEEHTSSSQQPISTSEIPVSSSEIPVSSSDVIVSSSEEQISSSSEAPISSSEDSSSSDIPVEILPINITVDMPSYLDSTKTYELSFTFDEEMFCFDSHSFSKDLAMLAFGNAIANQNKEMISKFYDDAGFNHILLSDSYDETPTDHSIGYAFAHKEMQGNDLVAVSIRGFNYGKEWKDNFNLGTSDDHEGFNARADEVYSALKTYLSENLYDENVHFFINGYSRGGAVANLLAKKLDDDKMDALDNLVSEVWAYTFEAPKGALVENNNDRYNNIFNVVSSGDLITYFAPEEYGFARYGNDIDIYKENIDELVLDFDNELVLPTLAKSDEYDGDPALAQYLIDYIVSYEGDLDDDTAAKPARTREEFASYYQEPIGYLLGIFFSLKGETTAAIKEAYSAMTPWQLLGLMGTDGLYNFLKPFLDSDGMEYNTEELRTNCNVFPQFALGPGAGILSVMMQDENAFSRIILLHTPEVNYALLDNYE